MKKAVLLSLLIVMCINTIVASADSSGATTLSTEVERTLALEIMIGDENGSFHFSDNITRGEFSVVAIRMMNLESWAQSVVNTESEFYDVPENHFAASSISVCSELGLVNGYEDGSFRPDEPITSKEAIKIIVTLLGYETVAMRRGGYPMGYIGVAASLGILKNVDYVTDEPITRGQVAQMVGLAVDVPLLENVSYGNAAPIYKIQEGETLQSNKMHADKMGFVEGVITANGVSSIDGHETTKGTIHVDGVEYDDPDNLYGELLGKYVELYYYETSGERKVIQSLRELRNEEMTVAADDIKSFTSDELTYYVESTGRSKTINFSDDTIFLYNGKVLNTISSLDTLKPKYGNVRVIRRNGGSDANFVFITETESFIVDKMIAGNIIKFSKGYFNGKPAMELVLDDEDYSYTFLKANGEQATLADITQDCAVTIKASKDQKLVEIVISDKKVEGVIDTIYNDDDAVDINGTMYEFYTDEMGIATTEFELKDKGVFILDANNYILGTVGQVANSDTYGYVIAVEEGSSFKPSFIKLVGFERTATVIDEDDAENISYDLYNKEIEVFTVADKVRYNSERYSSGDIPLAQLVGKMIIYHTDANNNIREIITPTYHNVVPIELTFNNEIMSFGKGSITGGFRIDTNTQVVCIPKIISQDNDFSVTQSLVKEQTYSVQAFDVDEETCVAKAVCLYADMNYNKREIGAKEPFTLVNRVTHVNIEGEYAPRIEAIRGDKIVNDICADDVVIDNPYGGNLIQGDLIKYSKNRDGHINYIKVYARTREYKTGIHDNPQGKDEMFYGMAYSAKIDTLDTMRNEMVDIIGVSKRGDGTDFLNFYVARKKGPQVFKFDRSSKRISAAASEEIRTYEDVGDSCSNVFIYSDYNEVQAVVIIED